MQHTPEHQTMNHFTNVSHAEKFNSFNGMKCRLKIHSKPCVEKIITKPTDSNTND